MAPPDAVVVTVTAIAEVRAVGGPGLRPPKRLSLFLPRVVSPTALRALTIAAALPGSIPTRPPSTPFAVCTPAPAGTPPAPPTGGLAVLVPSAATWSSNYRRGVNVAVLPVVTPRARITGNPTTLTAPRLTQVTRAGTVVPVGGTCGTLAIFTVPTPSASGGMASVSAPGLARCTSSPSLVRPATKSAATAMAAHGGDGWFA